ncbi:MAG TPA: IS66 family transposase [Gammaproteobacteria bacterium]|jgi:transposase|nr:IS66 family transposase [Gammaproteobacteria bacterium]
MKIQTNYNEKNKEELIKLLQSKDNQILFLEEYIKVQQLRHFANKSEKFNPNQRPLFDEVTPPKDAEKILVAEEEIQVASFTRKKSSGRKPLPLDLPRVPRVYDLTDEEKICQCGCELTYITDEKSEQLDYIPAKIFVIEYIKKKYACRKCEETIKTAKMPALPIPRSIAAPGLLSHILVSKFQDGLPLYRQEKILKRIDVDLPRSTLCLWVLKCAALLKPLMKLLHDVILNYDIAYADETTCQVLKEPNKGIQSKKYMWLFSGGPPDKFAFYYQYYPSRSHDVAFNFFEDFKGYLHCDGFSAYDALAEKRPLILVGCLYHARRKFMEVVKLDPKKEGVASHVIKLIAKLSIIEEEIKLLSHDNKKMIREEKAKPLLNELYDYLLSNQPSIPPKSLLGQAVNYTLNQWPKLLTYLQDGRLENNNNRSERAIKPFVMGRKAWLFADSVEGAHAAAIIYSLIETCKYHHVEPYNWLRYVLQIIPACQTLEEFEALLPFNIDINLLTCEIRNLI